MTQPPPSTSSPAVGWFTPWRVTALMAVGGSLIILLLCVAGRFLVSGMYSLSAGYLDDFDTVGAPDVIDDYMTAMYYRDAERAYARFSEHAPITRAILEAELDGSRYDQFDTYYAYMVTGSVNQTPANTTGARSFEEVMEDMSMQFSGQLFYEDGRTGTFDALVVYENGEWKIEWITLSVPPK